jgi:hypothetical protein
MVDHEFFDRMWKREQELNNSGKGPADDAVDAYVAAARMQNEMFPHIENAAQILAAAGAASEIAKGDGAEYAIDRWCDVIRDRAKALLSARRTAEAILRKLDDKS